MNLQQSPHEVIHTIIQRNGITARGTLTALFVGLVAVIPGVLWMLRIPPPILGPGLPATMVLTEMSELVTLKSHISSGYKSWNNHYQINWLLHGDVWLGVDMSKVRYETSDPEKRRVTISLPQPHLVASKVDHDQTRQLNVEEKVIFAGWRSNTDSLRNEVWAYADRYVQEQGRTEASMEAARTKAETVLVKFFDKLDWKLDVKWQNPSLMASVGSH